MYKVIERKACVVTGSENLEKLYVFKSFPVNQNTTTDDLKKDILLDLEYDICIDSGMIQVRYLLPEEIVYNYEHSRSIGKVWQEHHKEFAKFIRLYNPSSVFEIGGGAGYLEKYYNFDHDIPIPWTILEPNPNPVDGCRAQYEIGFFDDQYSIQTNCDTIIFSHLFEHMYRPSSFIQNIKNAMRVGEKLIFSVPNMASMLKKMQTNTLNFEHTLYLAEPYVDYLLLNNGFKIVDKKYYADHSIFYSAIRNNSYSNINLPSDLYNNNKKMFLMFINNYINFSSEVNQRMNSIGKNKIFLFGAHLFSQFLLRFGIKEENITAILDNDQFKHGRRLQGSNLICQSPSVLKYEKNPVVILRAGTYQQEIKQQILKEINADTIFWE